MQTTHCSSGGLLIHHHHHQQQLLLFKDRFPSPLHHGLHGGGLCPLPLFYLTTAAESTPHLRHVCRSRWWDSNAEPYNKIKSSYVNFHDDDDKEEENEDTMERGSEVLEDFIDSIWIFKVFKSYGWTLPFIILSMLLASGLKAFVLALAVPLGHSTFSFAIQRMWGEKRGKPRQKTKTRKRSYTRSSVSLEEENRKRSQGKRKVKEPRQSQGPNDKASMNPNLKNAPSYGGWDELDVGREFILDSSGSTDGTAGGSCERPTQMGPFSSKRRKNDTPLLLRLLLAVFPFLDSWTKML